jgi:ABC-2 type transport system permease protein
MHGQLLAVYGLWRRDITRFLRSRGRLVGRIVTPFFVLAFLGFGFRDVSFGSIPPSVSYLDYLVPGILGFTMVFSASFSGLAVLSDREAGFLKEIFVAPVSRPAIVLGRTLGATTTSLLQAVAIAVLAVPLGFRPRPLGLLPALVLLAGVAVTFIGFGLAIASQFRDSQGYSIIINFVIFPLAFLSGAFYPLANLPLPLRAIGYLNPLTYGIDGLRGLLVGTSAFPLWLDFLAVAVAAVVTVFVGGALFDRVDVT